MQHFIYLDFNKINTLGPSVWALGAKVFAPANGFFCLGLEDKKILNGREYRESVLVICNPSTRQSFTLPKWKMKRRGGVCSYLGYDPTKKHFKVLCLVS